MTVVTKTFDEAQLFQAIRSIAVNGKLSQKEVDFINSVLNPPDPVNPANIPPLVKMGLTEQDFRSAAIPLGCTYAQIRAVWEVECSGSGWFTDIRGDILNLDGPGGFIDGPALPKILFEALWFHKFTSGKYDAAYPNISSPTWNKALYVGGQGEWARLWTAMKLDHDAALKSASWGGPQIMGFNYDKAGYPSVMAFVDAMKSDEANHLKAFGNFIRNAGLLVKLRAISNVTSTCTAFAEGYNGSGQAANHYDAKLAAAYKKWSQS